MAVTHASKAQQDQEQERRPEKGVREIAHIARKAIKIDMPQNSDSEDDEEKQTGEQGAGDQEQDDESDPDHQYSSEEDNFSEADFEYPGDISSMESNFQYLLGKINMKDRLAVLDSLGTYYNSKTKVIEKDSRTIDVVESEADRSMGIFDNMAAHLSDSIDGRENHKYHLLWRYYLTCTGVLTIILTRLRRWSMLRRRGKRCLTSPNIEIVSNQIRLARLFCQQV
jgi:hypothetical protein